MKIVCCSTALEILFVFDRKIQNNIHFRSLFSDIPMSLSYRIRENFTNQMIPSDSFGGDDVKER